MLQEGPVAHSLSCLIPVTPFPSFKRSVGGNVFARNAFFGPKPTHSSDFVSLAGKCQIDSTRCEGVCVRFSRTVPCTFLRNYTAFQLYKLVLFILEVHHSNANWKGKGESFLVTEEMKNMNSVKRNLISVI